MHFRVLTHDAKGRAFAFIKIIVISIFALSYVNVNASPKCLAVIITKLLTDFDLNY